MCVVGQPPKLTARQCEDVAKRVALCRANRVTVLAREYGVSKSTIQKIANGYRPKHHRRAAPLRRREDEGATP